MKKTIRAILSLCFALLLCITFLVPAYAQEMPITGLVLVGNLPREADIILNRSDEQGNYVEELMTFEGAIKLVTLRQKVDETHPLEMPINDFLSDYFEDMREDELLEANPIAAYPSERIHFTTGSEEDTAVIDAVLIRTDEFYFAFWADTQTDIYSGYRDQFEEGEVPELIDQWVESLDLFDSDESVEVKPTGDDSGDQNADDSEPPYWNGLDFGPNLEYAEDYVSMGDPGDYLNPAEAARLTFDTMRDKGNVPEYSDSAQYAMTLVDIADVMGEECYVYRLDVESPDGTIGAAYAYAYQSGSIYMQGHGGQWVQP